VDEPTFDIKDILWRDGARKWERENFVLKSQTLLNTANLIASDLEDGNRGRRQVKRLELAQSSF